MKAETVFQGWITTSQGIELTGYTSQHLRRLARNGKVAAVRVGRAWLINQAQLEAYKRKVDKLGSKKHSPRGVG